MQIKIDEIIVPKRVRCELGDLTSLAKSMDKHGQLNPITITAKRELIAGQRRLEAAKLLGWETITVNVVNNLSNLQRLEIEIDENQYRKPFTEEELSKAYKQLEKIQNPSFWSKLKEVFTRFFKWLFRRK